MAKNTIVIGGGIIGLCTAYYLEKEGHKVTVLDKSDFNSGASYVNAGYITPSHIISLAAPEMLKKGIQWMLKPSSPFYIKPRLNMDFLRWVWQFKKSATKINVEKAIPIIKNINLFSRELYEELKASNDFDFFYQHKGLLMYYQTDKAGEEEWNIGKRAIIEGLKVENLSNKALQKIEPNTVINAKGAIYYHSDAHMTPNHFMNQLKLYLEKKGVTILANKEVIDITVLGEKVTHIKTKDEDFYADEYILTTGSWTQHIAKKLRVRIPIQAGKGYSINVTKQTNISLPAILIEAKVAVTPMEGFTRFAGTMEIGGINHRIYPHRVDAIAKAAKKYYPELQIGQQEKDQAQCGLRPCSPDGLPYIGRLSTIKNLTIGTGHAMMGWSLGPATGKLISEIISDRKYSIDILPFSLERKF